MISGGKVRGSDPMACLVHHISTPTTYTNMFEENEMMTIEQGILLLGQEGIQNAAD